VEGKIRKALPKDAVQIHELINFWAKEGLLLPVSLNKIYDNIRDFWIYETESGILGCAALHIYWEDLAEIRSLAVNPEYRKRGIGRALVKQCLEEAKEFNLNRVFVLTYQVDFFKKLGFREIEKVHLPQKVWTDCINCPKFPNCDETALVKEIKGELKT